MSYFGVTETRQYNILRQLTNITIPNQINMTYNYATGTNNGKISSQSISGETVTYQYDALNHLISAAGSGWSQDFGYDGFGNLISKAGSNSPPLSIAVDPATNRAIITNVQYDANGNPNAYNGTQLLWDSENHLLSAVGLTDYLYDSQGKRIWKGSFSGGSLTAQEVYFYGVDGQKLGTYALYLSYGTGQPLYLADPNTNLAVFFGAKRVAVNGAAFVPDRLGSNTAGKYFPYGEDRGNPAPNDQVKYATYTRDSATLLDYADQRYYSNQFGRFMTPDASGFNEDVKDPASWNAYSYTEGDPINFNDPKGLLLCGDIPGEHDGIPTGRTFRDILDTGTDYGLLAVTIFVESAGRANSQGFAEMAAIGAVIMNRFNIVNGYAKMMRSNGTVQSAPLAWGKADNTLASIIINPTQFEVWQGQGGTLTDSAQSRLDHALGSDANSAECYALQTAYYTGLDDLAYKGKNVLLTDAKTGLAFTGFNSFDYTQKYDWEQYIGQFGSANKFYGIPIPIPARSRGPVPTPPRRPRLVGYGEEE